MITLCMDTSQQFLVLALLQDGQRIAGCQEACWKRQSERIFPELTRLMADCGLTPKAIDEVVVTTGPGSYTGVRIAMTVAKVLCSTAQLPLYCLPTLELYGAGEEKAAVLLDARSQRAYFAILEQGCLREKEEVLPLSVIQERLAQEPGLKLIGDGALIGGENCYPELTENFVKARARWQKVDHIHLLVPEYLKPADEYLVKKS